MPSLSPGLSGMPWGTITFIVGIFWSFPRDGFAAFPLFPPIFPPLSEALVMDPSSPSCLLCWKSQSGGEWEVQQGKQGGFSQEIPDFLQHGQGSSKVWLRVSPPGRAGDTCPVQKPPKFYSLDSFMDFTYPRERRLAQELMGKKKKMVLEIDKVRKM